MKLYLDREKQAPSPRRVRIFMAEKGIELPVVELELHVDNRTPAFREKNVVGTLPVLELDDGTCISESVAICRYLEELHPEPPLFGRTPVERARIEMWLRRVELYLYLPIDFAPHFEKLAKPAGDEFRGWAALSSAVLDRTLAERRFIVGDDYSVVDAFALSAIDFGLRHCGYEIAPGLSSLARWHREVSARPSSTSG